MKKPTNIFRIDIEPSDKFPNRTSTHGWQVRISRQGKQRTKFFSDSRFNGRAHALAAAIQYRDRLLEVLPDPDVGSEASRRARSTSGVPGMHFIMKDDGSGTKKPIIQLSWLDKNGTRRSATYSLHKWALRRAVWNACMRLWEEQKGAGYRVERSPDEMYSVAFPRIRDQYEASKKQDPAALKTAKPELGE